MTSRDLNGTLRYLAAKRCGGLEPEHLFVDEGIAARRSADADEYIVTFRDRASGWWMEWTIPARWQTHVREHVADRWFKAVDDWHRMLIEKDAP